MKYGILRLASLIAFANASTPAIAGTSAAKPTVILVHGAFADASSWNGVAGELLDDGYRVIAAANPLRGVKSDGDYVAGIVASVNGPVILVGHSYGGEVISAAARGHPNVRSLVYVAAFAPDVGETGLGLSSKFPGSSLSGALAKPVPIAGGGSDLYILQDRFQAQFAADVPVASARLMAATQRPVKSEALAEPAGVPAWKSVPSWFVYGSLDLNIPPAAQAFMALRAKSRKTIVVSGASHVVMVSHPHEVVELIEEAAVAQ